MRNIEYRGLRTDGNGWVYGSYNTDNSQFYEILCNDGGDHYVHPETVGQAIIPDFKGVMIYEGDKIKCKGQVCEVRFDESHCYYALFNIAVGCKVVNLSKNNVGKFDMEILGNVHQ